MGMWSLIVGKEKKERRRIDKKSRAIAHLWESLSWAAAGPQSKDWLLEEPMLDRNYPTLEPQLYLVAGWGVIQKVEGNQLTSLTGAL